MSLVGTFRGDFDEKTRPCDAKSRARERASASLAENFQFQIKYKRLSLFALLQKSKFISNNGPHTNVHVAGSARVCVAILEKWSIIYDKENWFYVRFNETFNKPWYFYDMEILKTLSKLQNGAFDTIRSDTTFSPLNKILTSYKKGHAFVFRKTKVINFLISTIHVSTFNCTFFYIINHLQYV